MVDHRRSQNVRTIGVLLLLILLSYCVEGRAPAVQATPNGPISLFVSTIKEARRHLAAAAVARSVSIFAMYPIDTLKTRIQLEQANAMRMSGLYKGVGGSLLGQVPYG